jgi:single-stranded-DNA-specific exonuclease
MENFLDKLLNYYHLTYDEYSELTKEPSFDLLPSPYKFKDMDLVVKFINEKMEENTKILIYGDYDCDGVMSTSIVFNSFMKKGYKVGYYIPNRVHDGYGLTKEKIDYFKSLDYSLIICVDNGITLIEEVDYLNSIGMECIIIDHHTPLDTLPNAKYILHPTVSNFGKIFLSAGGVSFFFSRAFLGEDDPYLCVLGAISTVSDMMELKDYNRELVRLGLKFLNENKYPNISLLAKTEDQYTEDIIGGIIAPKINAVGRMCDDNSIFNVVRYFTTDTQDMYQKRAEWIESINNKRKDTISDFLTDTDIEKYNSKGNAIVEIVDVGEGLIGLIANRLMNAFDKPTVIFTKTNDGTLKGSARSKPGFNIIKCYESLDDLLLTNGGHALAGGLSIKEENFDAFKERFNKLAAEYPFETNKPNPVEISSMDINSKNYEIYRTFGPFGQGNKRILFKISNFATNQLNFSKDRKHILTKLSMNSSLIYFSYDKSLLDKKFVNFYGNFDQHSYRNHIDYQFKVTKVD